MAILHGKLVHAEAGRWDGYRATAAFTERAQGNELPAARFRSVALATDGRFTLELPEPENVEGKIDLAVHAPSGELVASDRFDAAPGETELSFQATRWVAPVVADAEVSEGAGALPRVFGRAMTRDGRPARPGETVVLWGLPLGGEARDGWPFLVATVHGAGYFSGERPRTRFASAFGTVAGGAAIAVPLDRPPGGDDTGGTVPERIVLVGDVPTGPATDSDAECDCDTLAPPRLAGHEEITSNPETFSSDLGGRCVDLTIPNRALEEVTWHAVVRISEPTVRAITLGETKPLPDALLDELIAVVSPLRLATRRSAVEASEGRFATAGRVGRDAVFDSTAEPMRAGASAASAASDSSAARTAVTEVRIDPRSLRLDAESALRVVRVGDTIETTSVLEAERASRFDAIRALLARRKLAAPGRPPLDAAHRMDWDETPTMHQATSIAHGHILTYRQTWHADGYSLGDLLYSLPLAPGQKKQIATIDWDRRDTAMRLADRESRETLAASIQRDRDVEEIVRGSLDEHVRAGSSAVRGAVGGGFGVAIGPVVFGGGGGSAWATSNAWQTSSRDVAGQAIQQVRDRTVQSASSVRSQRSTVVESVRQGESVRAETTFVANYNHCHAMTVQYFEVLRHFQLTHAITEVRECLFVPFALSAFDLEKALRWREPLFANLRRKDLEASFEAAARVRSGWADAHVPVGAHADEPLAWFDAELDVRLELPRPADAEDGSFVATNWGPWTHLLSRSAEEEWRLWLGVVTPAERDAVWASRIAPRIARTLFDDLTLTVVRPDGTTRDVPVDSTLVSRYRPSAPLSLSLRPKPGMPSMLRREISAVTIGSGLAIPSRATVRIEQGTMRYRTAYLHHTLFEHRLIQNDLGTTDDVTIAVRLDRLEKSQPRAEDRQRSNALLEHLNAHLEYYHRVIWLEMHPNRRFTLLDGFEAPNAGGRSVASVVENRLIGIVGNSMVMPLAPGVHLHPSTEIPDDAPGDLLAYYDVDSPPPVRVSVGTRGVFAEAVLGQCNSCEPIDDTRFWRWEDAPIPDRPPELGTVSTASRRRAPTAARPDAFSAPLVGLQSLGDLPAPTALKAALDLIGTPDLFRDLTGIDVNIAHAAQALSSALGTAQFFGGEAAKLAKQQFLSKHTDRVLKSIRDAVDKKLITKEQGQELTMKALGASVGADEEKEESTPTKNPSVVRAIERATRSDHGRITVRRPSGKVDVRVGTDPANASFAFDVEPPVVLLMQTNTNLCWAAAGAMMMNWRDGGVRTLEAAAAELGDTWAERVANNVALGPADLRAYANALGLVEEKQDAYTARGLLRLLQDFGPLWVVHDDYAENDTLVHARILVGIEGQGAADRAVVKMLDPSSSTELPEDFATMARRLQSRDATRFGLGLLHYPAS